MGGQHGNAGHHSASHRADQDSQHKRQRLTQRSPQPSGSRLVMAGTEVARLAGLIAGNCGNIESMS
jgi:hypothetical protein